MLICLSMAVVSCKKADIEVQSIAITPSADFVLNEGETQELTAVVTPADATNPAIMWESSDPTVASIEGSTVTAHSHGVATLTAIASNGLSESVELAVAPSGGVVVEDGWWEIYNAMGLAAFRDAVNGVVEAPQQSINGKLMADIYLDGVEWTPIGVYGETEDETIFYNGDFDGNDKKIFGLKIDADTTEAGVDDKNVVKGLFAFVSGEMNFETGAVVSYASIKDLTIVSPEVYGYSNVAALTVVAYGTEIENCHIDGGLITAQQNLAGICAIGAYVKFRDCSNYAQLTALHSGVAGIVTQAIGCEIDNCENYGTVEIKRVYAGGAGGIVGAGAQSEITNCNNFGDIITSDAERIGGIIGSMQDCSVSYCTNSGSILESSESAGGIVGNTAGTASLISFCENSGDITSSSGKFIGGILGHTNSKTCVYASANYGKISASSQVGGIVGNIYDGYIGACYNLGAVTANASLSMVNNYAGGILAVAENSLVISGVYNIGAVTSEVDGESGGLVGSTDGSTTTLSESYWVPSADGDAVDAIVSDPSMTADIETTLEALNGAALIDSLNLGVEKFITEFNADADFSFDITADMKVVFVAGEDGYPVLQSAN